MIRSLIPYYGKHYKHFLGDKLSFSAHKNKTQKAALIDLTKSILDLDRVYSTHPTPELHKK